MEYLEGLGSELHVSVISVAKLFAGAGGDREERSLRQFLLAFDVLPVTERVARTGACYQRDYGPSHGTGLADALIAATAEENGADPVTFNGRHFPKVETKVPYAR